jgi:iron complex outermembrane receptor protein
MVVKPKPKNGLNPKQQLLLFCTFFIATCPLPDAQAAEVDSFALSPEQLFNATVTSVSKTSEKLMDAPAAIYVLTNEDIMRSGATSIPEALRLVPGVQVARTHGGGWAISVRGFANSGLGNKLLVLIDGRAVYDQLFSGVYWDVQDTVLEDIDRIEVIRGPGATLYGANAVNGVINIITKSAKDTQGGLVSAIAGNQDRAITTGRYGGVVGDDVYYRAYAKYLDRGEETTLAGHDAHDPQQAYRSGFRSDWNGNGGKDSFTLQGDAVSNGDGQLRVSPANGLTHIATIEDIDATGWNILGRWKRELGDDSRLTVQSYADYTYRSQLLLADQRTTYDLDTQYELSPIGRHKIIVGAGYRLSDDNLTASPFVFTARPTRHDQLLSSFVQDKITLDPGKWFLTLGSKFEHNDYSGIEVQPNARLQWDIDDTQMSWASITRAVRTPSQLERDLRITDISPFNFFGELPNPNFESEELIAYELGYRRQLTPRLSADVATFYNDYRKLETVNLLPSGPYIINIDLTNGTKAGSYGAEVSLDWHANDKLRFTSAYSLLSIEPHGPVNSVNNATAIAGQSPQQQFNARSEWNIRDNLSFDTIVYYVDSLPNFNVKQYWRLDMNLGWEITSGLQFNLVGQNLFSGPHSEFTSPTDPFTPPVRIEPSVYGKLTWRF